MRNLNEPREPRRDTIEKEKQSEGEVISLESRRTNIRSEGSLVGTRQLEDLRGRWAGIQASFVDDPHNAVQEADALVSSAIKQIEEKFSDQRSQLEKQWSKGTEASTEDLRVAIQNYRSFFDRLLSM
jgi:hypothetical protein